MSGPEARWASVCVATPPSLCAMTARPNEVADEGASFTIWVPPCRPTASSPARPCNPQCDPARASNNAHGRHDDTALSRPRKLGRRTACASALDDRRWPECCWEVSLDCRARCLGLRPKQPYFFSEARTQPAKPDSGRHVCLGRCAADALSRAHPQIYVDDGIVLLSTSGAFPHAAFGKMGAADSDCLYHTVGHLGRPILHKQSRILIT